MTASEDPENGKSENHVVETIERQADRMDKSRRDPYRNILFGLGMFGVVGWSIAIPTVAGVFLGIWLDGAYPAAFSWTITLLFVGVIIGTVIAWRWVHRNREPD